MTKNEHSLVIKRPNLKRTEVNKTTRFMLPAIDLTNQKTKLKMLEYYGLVNCYIDHTQAPKKSPEFLYLVFNPNKEAFKTFKDFYALYKTYPNFVYDYTVDFNLVVVVFKINSKWKATYEAFKKSKYSQMSKEYADFFKNIDPNTGIPHVLQQHFVILKHKDYREHLEKDLDVKIDESAELMDALDGKEIFQHESEYFSKIKDFQWENC